jgi:serine/threonine protein phosphatase 1
MGFLSRWLGGGSGGGKAASARAPAAAFLPDGLRIYAMGDIHGRYDLLMRLEQRIRDDMAERPAERALAIYLGDYVDRGPDSRRVVEYLRSAGGDGIERHFLRGNHEETLLEYLANPQLILSWKKFGGLETLFSYGVDVRDLMRGEGVEQAHAAFSAAFPNEHLEFMEKLPPILSLGGYCFVHAGVKPGVPIERQSPGDLLWIRDEFLRHEGPFGKVVVHGHTPTDTPTHLPNRINVDTGAYLTGKLTAAVLEGEDVAFISVT